MQVMSLPITMERAGDDKLMIFLLVWIASGMMGLCSNTSQLQRMDILKAVDRRTRSLPGCLLKVRGPLEQRNQQTRNSDISHLTISIPSSLEKEICLDFAKNSIRPMDLVWYFNQTMRNSGLAGFTISNTSVFLDSIKNSILPPDSARNFCKMAALSTRDWMSPKSEYEGYYEITENAVSDDLWRNAFSVTLQKDGEKSQPTVMDFTVFWISFKDEVLGDRFINWPLITVQDKPLEATRKQSLEDQNTDWSSKVISIASAENRTEGLIKTSRPTKPVENRIKDLIKNSLPIESLKNRVECWLAATSRSKPFEDNISRFSLKSIEEEPLENQFEDCPLNCVRGESLEGCYGNFSQKSFLDETLENCIGSTPVKSTRDDSVGNHFGMFSPRSDELPKDSSLINLVEENQERRSSVGNEDFSSVALSEDEPMNPSTDCKKFTKLSLSGICDWANDSNPDFCKPCTPEKRTTSESSSIASPLHSDSGFGSLPDGKQVNQNEAANQSENRCSSWPTAVGAPKKPCSSCPPAVGEPKKPCSSWPTAVGEPKKPCSSWPTAVGEPKKPCSSWPTAFGEPKNLFSSWSIALEESKKKCSSCTTVVEESKFYNGRRYGLLMNCTHVFCYPCISQHTKSSDASLIKSAVCPVCDVKSEAVAASSTWKEGYEKEKFFKEFLLVAKQTDQAKAAKGSEASRRVPCKIEVAKRRIFAAIGNYSIAV